MQNGWNVTYNWEHEFPLTFDNLDRRDRPITIRATLTAPSGKQVAFDVGGEFKNGEVRCFGSEIPKHVLGQFKPEDDIPA